MEVNCHARAEVLTCGNPAPFYVTMPYLLCVCEMTFAHAHSARSYQMSRFLSHFATGLIGRFENWRARERAFQELAALDDRSLADIGLNRGDIPSVPHRHGTDPDTPPCDPLLTPITGPPPPQRVRP